MTSTNAKSRVFNTKLTGESRLVVKARNLADDSSTVRNIQGEQTKLVFWFTSEDVETLMSGLLQDGIERFITDTQIESRWMQQVRQISGSCLYDCLEKAIAACQIAPQGWFQRFPIG